MRPVATTRLFRSLRSRILLLATLVCVLLAAALTGFFLLARRTQSAIIDNSASHLATVVTAFANDFWSETANSDDNEALRCLTHGPGPREDAVLTPLSMNAFRRDPGVEGGFYSSAADALLGYAFPTNEGPGPRPKQDIPPRERPTIEAVAQQAAVNGKPAAFTYRGKKDVILFQAAPLSRNGRTFGSVWAMHRIPDADAGRAAPEILGVSCLALGALTCVGVSFWITRNVQTDVSTIQRRLAEMQQDLGQPRQGQVSALELEGILSGIDRLGISLKQKIDAERELTEQLHHKERLASLGQVAAGVAHELRNPLATIRLRAQMSLRTKDPEQLDRSARLTLEEIDRLSAVLDRLLYFAKPIKLQMKPFDLSDLCGDLLASLAPEIERRAIQVRYARSGSVTVHADALKIRQVLENLLRNAIESFDDMATAHKSIGLTLASTDIQVDIVIEDNGIGLPNDFGKKVFQPFFTTKARGTGLGLSIANEIARAHRGALAFEHAPGGGTLVRMSLPRRAEASPKVTPPAAEKAV